jgi:poly(hydroxyalkanoate) depolymerase family esterase
MLLYRPAALTSHALLVVVLHGCSQSAQAYTDGAGWLELADRCGFDVLAPEQPSANDAYLSFNWLANPDTTCGQGEAASIEQIVAWAVADLDRDQDRVFVTGLSSGGPMTTFMLATYPKILLADRLSPDCPIVRQRTLGKLLAACCMDIRAQKLKGATK